MSQIRRSHLGTSSDVSATCEVVQPLLGINWYIVTTSQIDQSYLRINDVTKTSQIAPSYRCTSCDVMMTSQHDPRRLDLYQTQRRRRYNVACCMSDMSKN